MRRDLLLLEEMIEAGERVTTLVADASADELGRDRQRRDALLWNFTVLGEASSQLTGALKERFPEVPWQQPSRLRNRIVHGYWSIDLDLLHTTARDQVPGLIVAIRRVLAVLVDGE